MKIVRVLAVVALIALAVAFGHHWMLREEAKARVEKLPAFVAYSRVVPIRVKIEPFTNRVEVGLEVKWAAKPKELFGELMKVVPGAIPPEAWPTMVKAELDRHVEERSDYYAMAIPYRVVVVKP
ncbi:MAG: hypothetical protein ACREQJ_08590 [Candidatus Binatia bacterium]